MRKVLSITNRVVSLFLLLAIVASLSLTVYAFTRNCFANNKLNESNLKSTVRAIVNSSGASAGIDYLATNSNCEWFNLKHWTAKAHCWNHAKETVKCLFNCDGFGSGDTYSTVKPNGDWTIVTAASKSGANATVKQFQSDMFNYAVPGDVIVASKGSSKHTVVVWKNDGSTFTMYQSGRSGGAPTTQKPSDLTGDEYKEAQWVDSVSFTASSSSTGAFDSIINGTSGCGYTLLHFKNYPVSYIGRCSYYPCYGKVYMKSSGTSVYALPCSTNTDSNSTVIESANGKNYTTTGIYKNTAGNYWYRVVTSSNKTGYVYSSDVLMEQLTNDDVKITDASLPTDLVKGKTFPTKGIISATYGRLTQVAAYIKQGSTVKCQKAVSLSNVSSYNLYPSDINTAMTFSKLTNGSYTYIIEATVRSYSAINNKLSSAKTSVVSLINKSFTVSDNGTHTHAYGSWTTVTKPTCTKTGSEKRTCSCGSTETRTIPALGHSYKSTVVAPTCTEKGVTTYTCSCGDSYQVTVPATGHAYDNACDATCNKCSHIREVPDHVYDAKGICIHCGHVGYTLGDPDGDGQITVTDALAALRIAAKLAEPTPELLATCDIDNDGEITVTDALAILRVAAKLADTL